MSRAPIVGGCVILALLGWLTYRRNAEWGTSVRLWEATVRESPLKPRPHLNLAYAYQGAGRLNDAMTEYGMALQLANDRNDHEKFATRLLAYTNIGQILIDHNQLEDARKILIQAWEEYPGAPSIASNLGLLMIRAGRYPAAIKVINEGIQHIPEYPWFRDGWILHYNEAQAYKLMGQCGLYSLEMKAASDTAYERIEQPSCP